ncbi:MAG: hypothetical protein RL375_3182 [Pseudomonadota bacterium]|jgi:predicted HTH domain antitoxin
MKLLDVYTALQSNEITLEQAATALGTEVKNLKIRMTKHGHRLPLVLSVLDKIADDQITRDEAAKTLDVDVRVINKLMNTWKVYRPLPEYAVKLAVSAVKWELRKKFACDFIAGRLSLEQASESAGVSTRQMRRWVSGMLDKHFGMVYKDLGELDIGKLRRISEHIAREEALEDARQKVAEQVAMGLTSVQEVGLVRAANEYVARHNAKLNKA